MSRDFPSLDDPVIHSAQRLRQQSEPHILAELRRELAELGQHEMAECDYTVVEVQRANQHQLLIIDTGWIELAVSAKQTDAALVEGLGVPRAAIAGILPGSIDALNDAPASAPMWLARPDGVLTLT